MNQNEVINGGEINSIWDKNGGILTFELDVI
jgi:hypothetical protein